MENLVCLDTNAIIDIIKNKDYNKIINKEICTTCINIFELSCWESPNPENKGIIKNLIEDIQSFGLSKDIAITAGEIFLALNKKNIFIDFRDVLVASICIENNLVLETFNSKHFEPLKEFGLRLQD